MRISDWSSDVCSSDLFAVNPKTIVKTERTAAAAELPDPPIGQLDQRCLPVGGGHRLDTGGKMETDVDAKLSARPPFQAAAGNRQQRVLAPQVLSVGRQVEPPAMLDPEPARIAVVTRVQPGAEIGRAHV